MPRCSRPPGLHPDRVHAIVFDLDGTLVDSYPAITESLNHARDQFDMPPVSAARLRMEVGRGLERLISDLVGTDRVAEGVRLFRERYAEVYASRTSLLPGARATLADLAQRGYRLSIASNKPARFGSAIASQLGLIDHLVAVHGPDTVGSTKPHPAMLDRCMADMQTDPAHGLYVGDMVLDVETASRAALPVVLVAGGSSPPADLQLTGCRVIQPIDELLRILPRSL